MKGNRRKAEGAKKKRYESGKRRESMKENVRGITLIALVVTIIVLLILAAISINLTIGDNGIISRAQESTKQTDIVDTKEQIQMELMSAQIDSYGSYTTDDIEAAALAVTGHEVDTKTYIVISTKGNEVDLTDLYEGAKRTWKYVIDDDGIPTGVTNGAVTMAIGDYVNYSAGTSGYYKSLESVNGYADQEFYACTYTNSGYGWRLLGVDEDTGELLIISTDYIGPDSGGEDDCGRTYFAFYGDSIEHCKYVYLNEKEEVNKVCSIYGNGTGATGARSLTVEDILELTGFDPSDIDGNGTALDSGYIYEYGNEVTYTRTSESVVSYKGKNEVEGTGNYSQFIYYDEEAEEWVSLEVGESITLKQDGIYFYPSDHNMDEKSIAYQLLFLNNENSAIDSLYAGTSYGNWEWLAGSHVNCSKGYVNFEVPVIRYDGYDGWAFVGSGGNYWMGGGCYAGVRPVVSLSSNISFTQETNGSWSIQQ